MPAPSAVAILVAALGGAAIGVERQWSGHAHGGADARFGGVRTFTLIGAGAGVAGVLALQGYIAVAAVLVAASCAIVVAGYVAASRRDVDATTEAAGLVVIAAGFCAGLGFVTLSSAIVAVAALLLVEKTALHSLVRRINDEELRAASLFGVMAVVVLPLLPEGPIARFGGLRPRELWLLVLLFTGFSFAGYVARRMFGAGPGYPLAGLLAGIVSSTSATFTFARHSRSEPALARTLALGAVAACTMLFPRVLAALLVLEPAVAAAFVPYAVGPVLVGAGVLVWRWRTSRNEEDGVTADTRNPLQLIPALQMAVTFQVVLMAVAWAHTHFGTSGMLASGAILGLTDVDALTISMARTPGLAASVAAQAIAVGVLSNCVMKAAFGATIGTRTFGRLAGGTVGAMAIVIAASLAAFGR